MTPSPGREIIHRELDTDRENPIVQVTETVAEIEDVEQSELTTVYDHLDHVLDYIFDNPPKPEAQVEIT
ncbi:MAG: HalOD1 output domain-containing protein, partial [Halobaculum sp.]